MKHEKRRFVHKVDFITSPGFIRGGRSRQESGLVAGGMYRVVTDLAIMGFDDESRRMKVFWSASRVWLNSKKTKRQLSNVRFSSPIGADQFLTNAVRSSTP